MPIPTSALRRRMLKLGLASAVAAPIWLPPAGARPAASRLQPTPAQTECPFYPLDLPDDTDGDLLRNGNVDYRQGRPAWV